MAEIIAVINVKGPINEERLMKYCEELETSLKAPIFHIDTFQAAAVIWNALCDKYFQHQVVPMSYPLRQQVILVNELTELMGYRPMLKIY